MSTLARAIAIAAQAHDGQTDKAGAPYILHPLRVMLDMKDDAERIVAVLHDVVEDKPDVWSFERLNEEGFSGEVIDALRAVTKQPDEEDAPGDSEAVKLEKYLRFVRRAAANRIGRRVKVADLMDNCDLSRIRHPSVKDRRRVEKYQAAIAEMHRRVRRG